MAEWPGSHVFSFGLKRKEPDNDVYFPATHEKRAKVAQPNDDFIAFDADSPPHDTHYDSQAITFAGNTRNLRFLDVESESKSNEQSYVPPPGVRASNRLANRAYLSTESQTLAPRTRTFRQLKDLKAMANELIGVPNPITLEDVTDENLRHGIINTTGENMGMAAVLLRLVSDQKCGEAAAALLNEWFRRQNPKGMLMSDVHPKLRHVTKAELKSNPGASIESVVRLLTGHGKPQRKLAMQFWKDWKQSHDMEVSTEDDSEAPQINTPPVPKLRNATMSLEDVEPLYLRRKIREEMRGHPGWSVEDTVRAFTSAPGKTLKAHKRHAKALLDQWDRSLRDDGSTHYAPVDDPAQTKNSADAEFTGDASIGELPIQQNAWVDEAVEIVSEGESTMGATNSHDESDDDASVGDRPSASELVYDRNYAVHRPINSGSPLLPLVTLQDILPADQLLQYRYFKLTNPASLVRCLSCGGEGHVQVGCPSRSCSHCGAWDDHFSSACPSFLKCGHCRRRGHSSLHCKNRASEAGGVNDPCDTCHGANHIEEECPQLWRSFRIENMNGLNKIPQQQMLVSCYNCGSRAHWGNDCPTLPDFLKSMLGTNEIWSSKYASQFAEPPLVHGSFDSKGHRYMPNNEHSGSGREEGSDAGTDHGYGRQYNYQLAQLAGMRDY